MSRPKIVDKIFGSFIYSSYIWGKLKIMFYCSKCAEENDYPITFINSYGECEICRKVTLCNECPSLRLPEKGKYGCGIDTIIETPAKE
jgi:hypothetical protein